jgi:predicted Zn-ribbon and HTH transcriptional regulator
MTKNTYIEREPIIQFIEHGLNEKKFGYDAIEILGEIQFTPTADVTPIRHGHWILTKRTKLVPTDKIGLKENFVTCKNGTLVDENNINKKAMIMKKRITIIKPKCSECGHYEYDEDDITPYCPNCGAKMDEGDGTE